MASDLQSGKDCPIVIYDTTKVQISRKIATRKSVSTVAFPARMLRTADRSPQRSYSGNLHCSPATESHLHLTEARARQHRSRNGGDASGAFRAIFT